MARRPHEQEHGVLALDRLHTQSTVASARPRRDRARRVRAARTSRRPAFASVGIVASALALLLAGGAMLSSASGATGADQDPLANTVRAIGGAPALTASKLHLNDNLVGIASTPSGRGYWVAAADGGVFAFGDAPFRGSLATHGIAAPVVGIAASPTGEGYWLVGSDGGVFAFGDAPFAGSIGIPAPLMTKIVGIAPTATGHGYWLAGADGGVFAFGDAVFHGSATSLKHAPIVGIASTSSGQGYYLLGFDGGVFAFGDARFSGSANDGRHLATGIATVPGGRGYAISRTDGSVVGVAGAASVAATPDPNSFRHPAVGIAATRGGAWLVTGYVPPVAVPSDSPSQDPFLKCTRAHESDSAGGYRAVSPDGLYHGAYQFLRSTWNNVARAAGRPDLVGVDPAAASPADQDQLALFLYRRAGAAPWGGRCAGLP